METQTLVPAAILQRLAINIHGLRSIEYSHQILLEKEAFLLLGMYSIIAIGEKLLVSQALQRIYLQATLLFYVKQVIEMSFIVGDAVV